MTVVEPEIGNTEMNEGKLLAELRRLRRALRLHPADMPDPMEVLSVGQRIADVVASIIGSWPFIIVQTALLAAWLAANLLAAAQGGDPYPFILLNLALSFQSAYAAPIIMMSQNRQQAIDRMAAENDYRVKIKAELEIELLHEKIDELRAQATIRGGKGACRPVGSADTVKGGSARERSRLMHAPSIRVLSTTNHVG